MSSHCTCLPYWDRRLIWRLGGVKFFCSFFSCHVVKGLLGSIVKFARKVWFGGFLGDWLYFWVCMRFIYVYVHRFLKQIQEKKSARIATARAFLSSVSISQLGFSKHPLWTHGHLLSDEKVEGGNMWDSSLLSF